MISFQFSRKQLQFVAAFVFTGLQTVKVMVVVGKQMSCNPSRGSRHLSSGQWESGQMKESFRDDFLPSHFYIELWII
jgi:hypothetical protein